MAAVEVLLDDIEPRVRLPKDPDDVVDPPVGRLAQFGVLGGGVRDDGEAAVLVGVDHRFGAAVDGLLGGFAGADRHQPDP
jgi:hypothetical protein